jgi:hypothetical protein
MFTTSRVVGTVAATAALVLGVTTPASAETGYVIAFSNEVVPLRVWKDPTGCHTFPAGGHVLFNDTDHAITMYSDPLCLFPADPVARVEAGKGTHISPNGSFKG